MPGGRPRKPRRTKIIQGTFRKDRNPGAEPMPPLVKEIPKPPAGMNRWGRRLWKKLAPELAEQGLLTTVDLATLHLTCDAYGQYEEAKQAVYRPVNPKTGRREKRSLEQYLSGLDPWIDATELSAETFLKLCRNSQTAPALTAMRDARQAYRSYLTEFGLGPAARNRINVPTPKKGSSRMKELLGARA